MITLEPVAQTPLAPQTAPGSRVAALASRFHAPGMRRPPPKRLSTPPRGQPGLRLASRGDVFHLHRQRLPQVLSLSHVRICFSLPPLRPRRLLQCLHLPHPLLHPLDAFCVFALHVTSPP